MPKVDAGGRWHATIPGKGNRWLPMPDVLLSQLNDLIEFEAARTDAGHGADVFKRDFKDLALRARNTKRLIAKGDIAGAQAKVQKLVDNFPWQDFSNLLESHWLEEEDINNPDLEPIDGQAWAIEEALQAFLDVDPGDFLDSIGEPTTEPGSVIPAREPAIKKAFDDLHKSIRDREEPLPLDDPRQMAWDSAWDNISDSAREMGKDFPAEGSQAWYELFMSSYLTALEMHNEEKAAADRIRQEDEETRRLEEEEAAAAATPELRPQGVLLKEFEKGYRRDNTVYMPQGAKGIVELGMLGLGTKVVRKKAKTVKENDRELVAARVAQVLGIDFRVEKVDSKQVIMDFIEGDSGATWYRKQQERFPLDESLAEGPGKGYKQFEKQREQIRTAMMELPQAKEIGLLDYLIGNEDRHDGNWIAGADGKAWPIDHGLAQFSDHDTESKAAVYVGVGGFMKASLGVVNESWRGGEDSWDPSKNWTHDELEDIKVGLENLRYDRAVRARKRWIDEALKRLDIVIEKMPPKPEPEPEVQAEAPAIKAPVTALKKAFEQSYKSTGEYVFQGARGKVEIGEVAGGRKVVYKKLEKEGDDLDTKFETDREVLSGLISNALGIEVYVAQVGKNEIVMDHIDGLTGNGWMRDTVLDFPLNKELGRKQFYDREMRQWDAMVEMPGGREIAMLDFLIENTDRHSGNWMVTKDNRVLPIDHGYAGFETLTSAIHGGQRSIDSPFVKKYFEEVVEGHAVKSINPGKSWTRTELEEIQEKVASLRSNFVDHPEWHTAVMAKIERLIDLVPEEEQVPEVTSNGYPVTAVRPDKQLKDAYEAGYTPTSDKIFQGNTATVEIGVIADGTQVVRKIVKQEKEADTEHLAGLVANALGIGPVTAKVGPNEIVMEYIADAKTGNGWINANQDNFKVDRRDGSAWEKAERSRWDRMNQAMIDMPGGKEMGLLDFLIDNPDRHAGNWMVKDDKVIPIDNGNARWHPMRYPDYKTGKEVELFNGSPFAIYWLGAKLTRYGEIRSMSPQLHWNNQELADIRSRLQDLRDDFIDHPDWHDAIMAKIDRVLEKVKK